MKLDSAYFDMIRTAPRRREEDADRPRCDRTGCDGPGDFPAPAQRGRSERLRLCAAHVREHNLSHDFFKGMSEAESERYRRDVTIGHRPTWRFGAKGGATRADGPDCGDVDVDSTIVGDRHGPSHAQRAALDALGLSATARHADVRRRFGVLVRQYHPDANGGRRDYEPLLRRVVDAYARLRDSGFFDARPGRSA